VYVFQRSDGAWANTAKLPASDGSAGDLLGASVAIDGDTIVAGATGDGVDQNATHQGSVYTFTRTGAPQRTQTAKLKDDQGAVRAELGTSVAIDGDTIVAGAPGKSVGTHAIQGAVLTFTRTGAVARTQTATMTASDGVAFDQLGNSVAIDGDTIVAGAPIADVGAHDAQGAAYTFARAGGAARTETGKLTAAAGAAKAELGVAVAIDGDTIVAGAPADNSASVFLLPPPPPPPPTPAAVTPTHASAQAQSSAAAAHAPGKPALSKLAVKPKTIHRTAAASSTAAERARITFTLSAAASVELRFQKAEPGRAVGKTCAKPSRANRGRPHCTRYATVGRFTVQGKPGANAVPFTGRRSARSLFPVGRYRLVATPTGASGDKGAARTTTLRIVRR
jgi:hypothetical protein